MFLLNDDMNSPSADVSLLTILLVRAEHMAEQCFSKLASAGRNWPLRAADFVYRWGGEEEEEEKNWCKLSDCSGAAVQKHWALHLVPVLA